MLFSQNTLCHSNPCTWSSSLWPALSYNPCRLQRHRQNLHHGKNRRVTYLPDELPRGPDPNPMAHPMVLPFHFSISKSAGALSATKEELHCSGAVPTGGKQVRDLPLGCTTTAAAGRFYFHKMHFHCLTSQTLSSSSWTALPHNPSRLHKPKYNPHQLEE